MKEMSRYYEYINNYNFSNIFNPKFSDLDS